MLTVFEFTLFRNCKSSVKSKSKNYWNTSLKSIGNINRKYNRPQSRTLEVQKRKFDLPKRKHVIQFNNFLLIGKVGVIPRIASNLNKRRLSLSCQCLLLALYRCGRHFPSSEALYKKKPSFYRKQSLFSFASPTYFCKCECNLGRLKGLQFTNTSFSALPLARAST